MKKVLLLGDSIRLGYQERVKKALEGEADVVYMEDNGRFAFYTLWQLNQCICEFGNPDIVHWNNGLWDLHHEAPMQDALTSLDEYLEICKRIINELKRTDAKIIFASTIPVLPDAVGRSNIEIDLYNKAAAELMEKSGVVVNDMNSILRTDIKKYVCPDGLHLNDEGYEICADSVVKNIKSFI